MHQDSSRYRLMVVVARLAEMADVILMSERMNEK